jgi:hypothetical protein
LERPLARCISLIPSMAANALSARRDDLGELLNRRPLPLCPGRDLLAGDHPELDKGVPDPID